MVHQNLLSLFRHDTVLIPVQHAENYISDASKCCFCIMERAHGQPPLYNTIIKFTTWVLRHE